MTTLPHIGTEERAVYELVRHGHVDSVTAGLYRDPLRRLEARGLVLRRPDGGFGARASSVPPPAASGEHESVRPDAMVTLVVRVPAEMKSAIEALAPAHGDLSKAARHVIGRGLASASGQRRRVAAAS
jgi:hypothetical protein